MINGKYISIVCFLFILGCDEREVLNGTLTLKPEDLGMKKFLLNAEVDSDQVALLKFVSPVVPPNGMEVKPATHEWVKFKYSKTGKVSFSILVIHDHYFRMVSKSVQRENSVPVNGVTIDGDEFVVVPNSMISFLEADNQSFNLSLEELNPQNLDIKNKFSIKCNVSIIKRAEAVKLYPEVIKNLTHETEEWSALHKVN
jgi:hypothetical protein